MYLIQKPIHVFLKFALRGIKRVPVPQGIFSTFFGVLLTYQSITVRLMWLFGSVSHSEADI